MLKEEKKTAFWILYLMMNVIAGSRWKPQKKEAKTNFTNSISVSDMGLGIYLLCFYRKGAPTHKGRWSKKMHTSAVNRYSNWCNVIKKIMASQTKEEEKDLNDWITKLVIEGYSIHEKKKNTDDNEDGENSSNSSNEEESEKLEIFMENDFMD